VEQRVCLKFCIANEISCTDALKCYKKKVGDSSLSRKCTGQRKPGQRIIVPSTACLWVIFGYIIIGSIIFAEWEGWDYLDSTYFCVTSLCKIGMGDLVPGWSHSTEDSQTKLIINFVYMLLGMGLIAMCYNLMKEEVYVKARELKEQLNQMMDTIHYKLITCCKSEPTD
ncbi:KCNKC protein, partial [Acromyrmex charruanus]